MPLVIRRRRYPARRPRRRIVSNVFNRVARTGMRGAMRSMVSRPNVYNFKRTQYYTSAFTVTTATAYAQAWSFNLSLLPNATDFTNLYDQYMIKKVVFKIIPKHTQNEINSGLTSNDDLPQIHSALDYDDQTNPTSIQQLCEYQSHKMTRGNKVHTRVIVPKIELGSTGVAANIPKAFQWIDCDSPTVDHRGIKVFIPQTVTAGTQLFYDVMVTYYFSMKNVL